MLLATVYIYIQFFNLRSGCSWNFGTLRNIYSRVLEKNKVENSDASFFFYSDVSNANLLCKNFKNEFFVTILNCDSNKIRRYLINRKKVIFFNKMFLTQEDLFLIIIGKIS